MPTTQPDDTLIASDESLDLLCDRLVDRPVIAIDTEFRRSIAVRFVLFRS